MGSRLLFDLVLFEIPVVKKWRTKKLIDKVRKTPKEKPNDSSPSGFNQVRVNENYHQEAKEILSGVPISQVSEEDGKKVYDVERELTDGEMGYINQQFEEMNVRGYGFRKNL